MKKFLVVSLLLVFISSTLAEDTVVPLKPTVAPTEGSGDDDIDKGATSASVMQTVTLRLPQSYSLTLRCYRIIV